MFPEGGQNRKHCFLAMFPEGGQTRKHCFLAMFPEDYSVLGSCGLDYEGLEENKYKNTAIRSDQVACLHPVDGKCPHGMLRVDSEEEGRKACDVRRFQSHVGYELTDKKDPRDPRFCPISINCGGPQGTEMI
ncbi:Hypothetical predicted protein [Paramuricea clavata]|uniref:Uncharacterized protein n=1 Tax=Paramuricea clavata TaxID=317549 RepID=A0A6S7FQN5_PARCT|nr:Hypothetical predicted protein [Paramuricea clavata]